MPHFSLPDTEGGVFNSAQDIGESGVLVIFMCNHCPFVIHLRETLASLSSELIDRGLTIVGISSNDVENYPQDGPEEMKREKREAGYRFPYLYDASQEVAKAFDAACTPDFFLFDGKGALVYRGQFDDSRPGSAIPVTGDSLRAACESLLATGEVSESISQLPSLGCNIKWRSL
jgi:peroxiredoxin